MSAVDQSGSANDAAPVYAVVNKSMKRKKIDKHEEAKATSDDRSRLYSKVDKSKKQEAADVQAVGTDDLPTQCNITDNVSKVESSQIMTQSSNSRKDNSAALDTGYESIKPNWPAKDAECGYDTVGEDFGYASVDVAAEKDDNDCLPSLAMLASTTVEHVYDVVPENPSDLRHLSTDYEDIREISLDTQ